MNPIQKTIQTNSERFNPPVGSLWSTPIGFEHDRLILILPSDQQNVFEILDDDGEIGCAGMLSPEWIRIL